MRENNNTVFLNLLRPLKSAFRVGEKQILTKLSKKKVNFSENCNFRKSSSRVGESSILKKKWSNCKRQSIFGEASF